jgi:hypothetical protein
MSSFKQLGHAVTHVFNSILKKDAGKNKNVFLVKFPDPVNEAGEVIVVDGAPSTGDQLWAHYLESFPAGTNPMFRERTEHDCSTCRNFVRNLGAVVWIEKDKIVSVWDVKVDDATYQHVADEMSKLVKSLPIDSPFIVQQPSYGAATTSHKGETWHHFSGTVPPAYLWAKNPSDFVGEKRNDVLGLRRSILEISDDACEIVAELIDTDNLYKGEEYKHKLVMLRKAKREWAQLKTEREREIFLWLNAAPGSRVHSSVFGTLLVDLTQGEDLEIAVKKYEDKTSGTNFQRPKALVTQRMLDDAKKALKKLGLEDSLARRYAVREDISVNDVLFVDGSVKPKLLGGALDDIKPTAKSGAKLGAIAEITARDFLSKVLPKIDSMEVFVQNLHVARLVSLTAPVHADAAPLFKWDNGFCWSYKGDVTDAIKERVKKAGGNVEGDVRISLSWHNSDDLDLSVNRSGHGEISYSQKSALGGHLDVDMNAYGPKDDHNPVENIFWTRKSDIKPGTYNIVVNQFSKRVTRDVGFEVQIEIMGQLYTFEHPQDLRGRVTVGKLHVAQNGNIEVEGFAKGAGVPREEWGIQTEGWNQVELVTRSPNYWNEKKVGHEHLIFILKGCKNPDSARGFYNEYLRSDLAKHRKVLELLGSQMRAPFSENQLSGIGFSMSNDKNEVQVRVKGTINRVYNIKF